LFAALCRLLRAEKRKAILRFKVASRIFAALAVTTEKNLLVVFAATAEKEALLLP